MAITGLLKAMMTWGLLADCLYQFKWGGGGWTILASVTFSGTMVALACVAQKKLQVL